MKNWLKENWGMLIVSVVMAIISFAWANIAILIQDGYIK